MALKNTFQFITVSLIAAGLTACSSVDLISEAPTCGSQDWFENGRQDGVSGMASQSDRLQKTCGSAFNDETQVLYTNGYDSGLVEYCSPANAFKLGQMGSNPQNRCPELMRPEFEAGLKKGVEARQLKATNEALAKKIETLSQKLAAQGLTSRDLASVDEKADTNQLERLKKLYAQNQKKLSAIRN